MSNNVVDAEQWFQKGNDYVKLQNYGDAIECFNKVIEIDRNHVRAWFSKGIALGSLAIECYDKAIEIEPKFAYAWYNKGLALFNLERYEEAIECYDKAIEIDSKFAYAWYSKGNALFQLKKYDEAIECYDKAIEINSKFAYAWSPKSRPIGVTIMAMLNIFFGAILLITLGIILPDAGFFLSLLGGIGIAIGVILVAIGIVPLVIAYGLLKGQGWARKITVVLSIISIVLNVMAIAAVIIASINNNISDIFYYLYTASIISINISGIILYYLYRPHVKAYFGKGASPSPPAA